MLTDVRVFDLCIFVVHRGRATTNNNYSNKGVKLEKFLPSLTV